jgi:hypothetical protein
MFSRTNGGSNAYSLVTRIIFYRLHHRLMEISHKVHQRLKWQKTW